MFLNEPNREELRQGDIIQGLYFPMMNCRTMEILGIPLEEEPQQENSLGLSARAERKSGFHLFSAKLLIARGLSIILSQCCDLERRNNNQDAIAMIVAPLRSIGRHIRDNSEKFSNLQSNILTHFVNQYYIPQYSPLQSDYMVDFNLMVSIPQGEYNYILSRKVLQMTDEARARFKIKLTHHFGRAFDEHEDKLLQQARTELMTK